MVDAALVKKTVSVLEALGHLTLTERVLVFVGQMKAAGNKDVFAKRVHLLAKNVQAGTAAATYSLQLLTSDGILLIDDMQHPAAGAADCLVQSLRVNGLRYIDSAVLADQWMEDETTETGRGLPWPIVCGARDTLEYDVTQPGALLNTVGLVVSGFHVDEFTAEVFRQCGELWMRGVNQTMAAGAVMTTDGTSNFQFQRDQELTHLVAKETLGATVVRTNVSLQVKKDPMIPAVDVRSFVVPPASIRKPRARCSVAVAAGDSFEFSARYTGNGVDTAKVQLSLFGRRRYRECA